MEAVLLNWHWKNWVKSQSTESSKSLYPKLPCGPTMLCWGERTICSLQRHCASESARGFICLCRSRRLLETSSFRLLQAHFPILYRRRCYTRLLSRWNTSHVQGIYTDDQSSWERGCLAWVMEKFGTGSGKSLQSLDFISLAGAWVSKTRCITNSGPLHATAYRIMILLSSILEIFWPRYSIEPFLTWPWFEKKGSWFLA